MIPFNHEFIRHQEDLYNVIRKYPEVKVKTAKIDELRQLLFCDVTLKKDGILYFCKRIPDAEIVTD